MSETLLHRIIRMKEGDKIGDYTVMLVGRETVKGLFGKKPSQESHGVREEDIPDGAELVIQPCGVDMKIGDDLIPAGQGGICDRIGGRWVLRKPVVSDDGEHSLPRMLATAFVEALRKQPEEPYLDKLNDLNCFVIDGRCDLIRAFEDVLDAAADAGYVLVRDE